MIRLVQLIKRRADVTQADFDARWRDAHGPLVASHQTRLGILRYVQTHRSSSTLDAEKLAIAKRGDMESPFDGVGEFWFGSERTLSAALSSAAGRDALAQIKADVASFADLDASPSWFAYEYPQIGTQRERVVARAKTGILKIHFSLRSLPGQSIEEAQHYWRTMHGPLVRSHAVARGTLCYVQVHRFETPLAEMQWRPGKEVEPYFGHAEAWFDTLVPRAGVEAAEAEAAAIADERNFIDWRRSTLLLGKELVFVDRYWL